MIKKLKRAIPLVLPLLVFSCTDTSLPVLSNQYILSEFNIANLSGCGYAKNLVDEQQSKSGVKSLWKPSEEEYCVFERYSIFLKIDSGNKIKNVYLHSNTEFSLNFEVVDKLFSIKITKGWNILAIDAETDGVLLIFPSDISISELLVETVDQPQYLNKKAQSLSNLPFQEFIGTNSFVDVPIGLIDPFGAVREYHDWPDWNEPQKDSIYLGITKNGFDFISFYLNLKRIGKTCIPVIQKSPYWLTKQPNQLARAHEPGKDPESPNSYSRFAYFFQKYVSFFSNLQNGGVSYFENGNETDRWWEGKECFYSPISYASLSSAAHDSALNKINGLNSAKSNYNLVMAGMANPKIENLNALKYWCEKNRGGDWPWSVINFHEYSNLSKEHTDKPQKGISPEAGNIFQTAKQWVEFRNRNNPSNEVWVTEFGFDTQDSPQKAEPTSKKNSEQVQADWILRSYFIYAMAGVDRAFQYMIRDFGKSGLYATSGFFSNTLREPYLRPSWYATKQASDILNGCVLKEYQLDTLNNVYKLVYSHTTSDLKVHVFWLGTHEDKEMDYPFECVKDKFYQLNTLDYSSQLFSKKSLSSGKIRLSETPLFIQESNNGSFNLGSELVVLDKEGVIICNEIGEVIKKLNDEDGLGNPVLGLPKIEPNTFWSPGYTNKYNNSLVVKLNEESHVHSISIFDGKGDGKIEVSISFDGVKYDFLGFVNMRLYNKWQSFGINQRCSWIRLKYFEGKPEIGEVLVNVKKS